MRTIRLWRLGGKVGNGDGPENYILPSKDALEKLIEKLKNGEEDIVWGPELNVSVITENGVESTPNV